MLTFEVALSAEELASEAVFARSLNILVETQRCKPMLVTVALAEVTDEFILACAQRALCQLVLFDCSRNQQFRLHSNEVWEFFFSQTPARARAFLAAWLRNEAQ